MGSGWAWLGFSLSRGSDSARLDLILAVGLRSDGPGARVFIPAARWSPETARTAAAVRSWMNTSLWRLSGQMEVTTAGGYIRRTRWRRRRRAPRPETATECGRSGGGGRSFGRAPSPRFGYAKKSRRGSGRCAQTRGVEWRGSQARGRAHLAGVEEIRLRPNELRRRN